MPQVAHGARVLPLAGLALLAFLCLLALSERAGAVGEAVEPIDEHTLAGDPFRFRVVAGVGDTVEQVSVTCPSCRETWTTPPLTAWDPAPTATNQRQKVITFPSVLFPASASGHPIHAETYTIRVLGSLAQGNVTVHVVDNFTRPDGKVRPTDTVTFQLAGLPPGAKATFNLSKWTRTGAIQSVGVFPAVAGNDRVASVGWRVPREAAADYHCPQVNWACRNYTLHATAPGRSERVVFGALPAELNTSVFYVVDDPLEPSLLPLGPGPLELNRTERLSVAVTARYPDGSPLHPNDRISAGNASLNGTLPLLVERVPVAQGRPGPPIEVVGRVWAHLTARGWRADWTIPKGLNTTQAGAENPQYRVRLAPMDDKSGNHLPEANATPFKVHTLRMVPEILQAPPDEVERLANATVVFRLRYADGTFFTNRTNTSALRAQVVDANGDTVPDIEASMEYLGNGTWAATFKPGIRFGPLGLYKLRIREAADADGNEVVRTDTTFFTVTGAELRAELVTRVQGEVRNETRGFHRGEGVSVQVTLTYPDGTPFNRSRLKPNTAVILNITKVDENGLEYESLARTLGPENDARGQWGGGVVKIEALNDTNPLGPWRWRVQAADLEGPPNEVAKDFTRWVRGAPVEVHLTSAPDPFVRPGDSVSVRFVAHYTDRNHTALTKDHAGEGFEVLVHPLARNGTLLPAEVKLVAVWDPDRLEWYARWRTDVDMLVGDYALTIRGQDLAGNVLETTTTGRVSVFVDASVRQVLREPPPEVHRGEVVLVLFDGVEGDLGPEGSPKPRIELHKWNPVRNSWDRELADVRVESAEGGLDHLGRLATGSTTNLGTYRFALVARDARHAAVQATSATFKVLPTEMLRSWIGTSFQAVAEPVGKGAQVNLQLERQEGDVVREVAVYHQGERVANGTSFTRTGRFDITWQTSYAVPAGAFELVVRGRDLHNNSFASPSIPVNVTGVDLTARVPSSPAAAYHRSERLELRALLQYPDQTHVKTGRFEARVLTAGQVVDLVPLALNRSAWVFTWASPGDAPLGTYRVLLSGDDGLGGRVRETEIAAFTLGEGILQRTFTQAKALANRTELVQWILPADGNDTAMRFVLRDEAGNRREMPHNVTKSGDYLVQWRTAKEEKLTRYVLEAQGTDTAGNAIVAESRTLLLRAGALGAVFVEKPAAEIQPGQLVRWAVELRYGDGSVLKADPDNPLAVVMLQLDRVVQPSPDLDIDEKGRWVITWVAEKGKHAGSYKLAVAGKDAHGNEVQLRYSDQVKIDEGLIKEIFGVPGFEALLVPLALAGAALLAARRRAPGRLL